jgi:hypothetical protein
MKFLFIPALVLLSIPEILFAQDRVYSPLVDLSNAGQGSDVQSFEQYINFLYGMSIAVAALLAVIKIIVAGAKYMLSDVVSNKGEALKDIQGAIIGLLIILSAVIILELINPQLTKKNIVFKELPELDRSLLHSLAVTVAGGQTTQQYSDTVFNGVDACIPRTDPVTSNSGKTSAVVANAATCTNTREALSIFERNCEGNGGQASSGGPGSNIVTCWTAIDGARETSNYSSEMQRIFGADNVTIEGRVVTINIGAGCEQLKNATSKTPYDSCMSQARTNASLPCGLREQDGIYGRFTVSSGRTSATCEIPSLIRTVDSFRGYDPDFPNTVPESEEEFERQCVKANGTYIEDAVTTILQAPYSPLNDRCVIY